MKPFLLCLLLTVSAVFLDGCAGSAKADARLEAPPRVVVEREPDASLVKVDHPEQFPVATAVKHLATSELSVTGVVTADVSRNVPVVSMASGRAVEVRAKLGDQVAKGQLLLRIRSSDIAQAVSDYRKAVADEMLAHTQLDRSKLLYDKGAIARKDLEVAEDVENKARVDVETTEDRLHVLGTDTKNSTGLVDVYAPSSGVIVEQNVTAAAGVKTLDNSPNLFTIADLSSVWILCDVYENDLPDVRIGEFADVRLAAYPGRVFRGRISNIGPVLDPNLRSAKVRLEMPNPGLMRVGMFVTAAFHGAQGETRAAVPAAAVLHLHDRDWVYQPAGRGQFRRVEVTAGAMLDGGQQEILSGLAPGGRVAANALVLQNTVEQ
ncbi:MAG: efflux RND transporter periplasmic adaptor subunit [Acidobacteria bacterium]|nr:efflux RND transporter periplasmic adaptor subunit [Acidobacteriota bacterium]